MEPRIIGAPSDAELDRRWAIVRAMMADREIDALVMQNSNDWLGGYVRWFTGSPAYNAYPRSVVFLREGGMIVVEQGPFDGRKTPDPTDPAWRGVSELRTTPSYVSAHYTAAYDAEIVLDCLASRNVRSVGWVAPATAYHGFGKVVDGAASEYRFTDVTDDIDTLKAVKSAEEWLAIERTATLQDAVIEAVRGFIKPGLRDFEVAAFAQYEAQRIGAEQGIFLSSSSEATRAAVFLPPQLRGRVIDRGDCFALLVETNGPGGYYTEIGRMFSLGEPNAAQRDAVAEAVKAQDRTANAILPGASAADIAAEHDRYMIANGHPPEKRLYSHGQGYDMVERPLVRHDESMAISADMNIVIHPGYVTQHANALICDNFRVTENGAYRLHQTERAVIEVA